MEGVSGAPDAAGRRPTRLDLVAGILLAGAVILHIAGMVPTYSRGATTGSIFSQPDQAALYSVLAAGWVLALVVGLTGPGRIAIAAAIAVGLASTELGFRVSDLGSVVRYGSAGAGPGLWIMTAAWVVGAAGAAVAVVAARSRRSGNAADSPQEASPEPGSNAWWPAAPAAEPASALASDLAFAPGERSWEPETVPGPDSMSPPADAEAGVWPREPLGPTGPGPAWAPRPSVGATSVGSLDSPERSRWGGDTVAFPALSAADAEERKAWTIIVTLLALVVAGAFLPSWDHYVVYSTTSGRALTFNLGNAFSGPWEVVVGNVLVAVALVAVPVVSIRLRNRAVGAAAVGGGLIVLASQFTSAVVQVDQRVVPSLFGFSSAQVSQLGLVLTLKLTVWYTIDALAAFGLLIAVMAWATLRVVQENSPGTLPSAPEARNEPITWVS